MTQSHSRIFAIDALRGFALAGVAIVHMVEQYIAGPPPEGFVDMASLNIADYAVFAITNIFIRNKFFALFSILFGLSFSLQMDTANRRGENFSMRFLWRAALLFGIGYVHQLFYRGDILTIYALLAPFLIPFYKVKPKWILLASAVCLFSVPRLLAYIFIGNGSAFGIHSPMEIDHPDVLAYFEALQTGSWTAVAGLNAGYGMLTKMDFQVGFGGRLYLTLGYFFLGLWIGKMGFLRDLKQAKSFVENVLKWAAISLVPAIGLTAVLFMNVPQPVDFSNWLHIIGYNISDWIQIALTLVILSAFLLLYLNKKWEKGFNFFVPYGRMALTNYLLQSILGTFLLFGWGLGFLGKLSPAALFGIACLLIIFQSLASKWWLAYFKYGPLEWLWRSATFFKAQAWKPAALPAKPNE